MDDARTAPNADIWFSSQMRQRLLPPDDGTEGEYPPRAYGRLACLVLGVLAVHAFVAGGLLFWPHERPAGGQNATIAMVFEPPVPPVLRPVPLLEQNTMLTGALPQSVAPPTVPEEDGELPSIPLPRKLFASHVRVAAPPAARNASTQAAPVLSRLPAAAQPEGAEKLSCSPVQARYPAMARQLQEEGEALVQVVLDAGGVVVEAHLVRSTGYDDLDEQAVLTARSMRCTPPAHPPLTGRIPVAFHIQ
ncbi:MAG: energy transducer TonB [Acetobacter peroxydans]|jgi:protein TonB|nr:energy transducer TonB [Acetobacter peroxydans]MCI2079173.1 energy transducer TonB [Acetobacter peroxydans]